MRGALLGAALAVSAAWSGGALAQVKSPSDLAAEIEQSRGVKVLKLKETRVDGRPVELRLLDG